MNRQTIATDRELQSAGEAARTVTELVDNMARVVHGKREVARLAVLALLARGHVLLEDVPGVGKTTLALSLARSVGCDFRRIQCTSDLLPSDVIGVSVFNPETRVFEFRQGPIFTQVLMVDELNRTTPKTQSSLLEAMGERRVSVEGRSFELPEPFLVVATQNPLEHHGTFPLPDSQLDRFLVRLQVGYPDAESETRILMTRELSAPVDRLEAVADPQVVRQLQQSVGDVQVTPDVARYVVELVRRSRGLPEVKIGVSPRGTLALFDAARALALSEGRDYVIPDDAKRLAVPVLAHRLVLVADHEPADVRRELARALIEDLVETTPVPL